MPCHAMPTGPNFTVLTSGGAKSHGSPYVWTVRTTFSVSSLATGGDVFECVGQEINAEWMTCECVSRDVRKMWLSVCVCVRVLSH
jgi:hypothetical protein